MGKAQTGLGWRDGSVPVSHRFDDPYFSIADGLAETRHVFLEGNGLPARFRPGFHIAELGFGTGLNLLAAWAAWDQGREPGALRYTGFEAFPISAEDMARAHAAFPELADYSERLVAAWAEGPDLATLDGVTAKVIVADARDALPRTDLAADAWFLDGFAPAKNPELWQPDLLAAVFDRTAPGGSAATYTAAGAVRRALAAAGFEVERRPGFGRKRHMTVARKPA